MTIESIERFIHAQVKAWNAGDREAFLGAYREAAPNGLQIEYVGRPNADGWSILEGMWAQQNAKIEIIETIELYRFDAGRLQVRYFIKPQH
jgi:hypothetical protein